MVPLWETTCPAHVYSVRSLLTTAIGRSLSRKRHFKHDSGRAAITVLCTGRQSHSFREHPAIAHHCIPECANISQLTWSTAAVRNAITSEQRDIAASHAVSTFLNMLLAKQPHSIIPLSKPKRTIKMCRNVLGRSTDNSTEHDSMSLGSHTHVNSMDDDTELVCFACAVHVQFKDFCAQV